MQKDHSMKEAVIWCVRVNDDEKDDNNVDIVIIPQAISSVTFDDFFLTHIFFPLRRQRDTHGERLRGGRSGGKSSKICIHITL